MRRLIYVPVVHDTWTEYFILLLEDSIGSKLDKNLVRGFRECLSIYWDKVDSRLASETIQRVYQDSCYDSFD